MESSARSAAAESAAPTHNVRESRMWRGEAGFLRPLLAGGEADVAQSGRSFPKSAVLSRSHSRAERKLRKGRKAVILHKYSITVGYVAPVRNTTAIMA